MYTTGTIWNIADTYGKTENSILYLSRYNAFILASSCVQSYELKPFVDIPLLDI